MAVCLEGSTSKGIPGRQSPGMQRTKDIKPTSKSSYGWMTGYRERMDVTREGSQILYWKEMRKIKLLIKNLVLLGTKCSINRGFYPFENKGQMRDDAAEWVISLASGMRQTRFRLLVVCLWDGDSTKPQFPYF